MTVPFERRAVLAVVHVAAAGKKKFAPLYRGIEGLEKPRLEAQLREAYGIPVVRAGDEVTSASFVADVRALTERSDVETVDVVLTTHGGPGEVIFTRDDRVEASSLAPQIASPKLRFLYDTACYGHSHADAFLGAGFKAAVGSKGKNTNGWAEYHHLMRRWAAGDTVTEAVEAADRLLPRLFWDEVARLLGGMREVSSKKVVSGDPLLRITD